MSGNIRNKTAEKNVHAGRRLFLELVLACLFTFAASALLSADEIYFKSGYAETAVVIRETEDSVTFKTEMGTSKVAREKVEFIDKATDEKNRVLLRKWREKQLQREEIQRATREAERKFEQEQIAKGLVNFEGEWMSPEKRQQILDLRQRARKHRQDFEAEQEARGLVKFQHLWVTPEHLEELRKLEPQIYQLYDDIDAQQESLEAVRSAMLTVDSLTLEDAERFTKRIEEIKKSIAEKNEQLGKLLKRADEIETQSVRYVVPGEFRDALDSGEGEPE